MGKITKVIAPVSNVNDTSVTVYEFLAENNSYVTEGQAVIAVETSKAAMNIESPADGYIRFTVNIGDEVPNGSVLAVVGESAEDLDSWYADEPDRGSRIDRADSAGGSNSVNEPHDERSEHISEHITEQTERVLFGISENTATLGEIMLRNGEWTDKGDVLCRVRGNNGINDITSPTAGYVYWNRRPYETVRRGEHLGFISDRILHDILRDYEQTEHVSTYDSLHDAHNHHNESNTGEYSSTRISAAARRILERENLTAEKLGLSGLITERIVLEKLNKESSNADMAEPRAGKGGNDTVSKAREGGKYEKLSRSKRSEANFLSEANKDAVVSQVSVSVPTRGIFSACAEDPELAKKFSAVIIFETSRLLKNYRNMLSVYEDGRLFVYDDINVGYALSIGEGLKVPVYRNSDRKSLEVIIEEKEHFIEKYISGELSPDDLSGGTFTITDLSSSGCFMFNPVLNLGQSAILGMGGENASHTEYPLILAFDHRVTDGAEAAEFLCKLRDRLVSHETVLLEGSISGNADSGAARLSDNIIDIKTIREIVRNIAEETNKTNADDHEKDDADDRISAEDLCCDSCYRTAGEIEENGNYLFKVLDKTGKEKHICSICMMGW